MILCCGLGGVGRGILIMRRLGGGCCDAVAIKNVEKGEALVVVRRLRHRLACQNTRRATALASISEDLHRVKNANRARE